jgi:hypothetical protein
MDENSGEPSAGESAGERQPQGSLGNPKDGYLPDRTPCALTDAERCTAHSRGGPDRPGGERCRKRKMAGREVCELHGGKTPRGPASPHFKHGRYSRDTGIPASVRKRFEQSYTDPELLSRRRNVALLRVRADELLANIDTGETLGGWDKLRALWADYKRAIRQNDGEQIQIKSREIDALIAGGLSRVAAWRDWKQAAADEDAAAFREWKRLVDLRQLLTIEQGMVLIHAITSSVKQHVRDPEALKAISRDLMLLLHHEVRGARTGDGPEGASEDDSPGV